MRNPAKWNDETCTEGLRNLPKASLTLPPRHERDEVQKDFLKYTAQKIGFDLVDNNPELVKEFKVNGGGRKHQFWERNTLSTDFID